MKSLFDLRADECHYPLTQGYECYCGQPVARRSYCDNHYAVVYVQLPVLPEKGMARRVHKFDDNTLLKPGHREHPAKSVDEIINTRLGTKRYR